MPFTPFHMGPGILIKALLQGSFSLMVFGWAQIVMDIQPLLVMITGAGHLHGFSHTYIGAGLLGLFAALTGKYLAEIALRVMAISSQGHPITIGWRLAISSALIGTFSHVLLDAIMHDDLHPYYPISDANPLLHWLSDPQIYALCLVTATIGALLYFGIQWWSRGRFQ